MADLKTIKLSGNDYAPVDERIKAFHSANGNGSIRTVTALIGADFIESKATVIPDVSNPERYFTGSAMGKIGREKAYEKLETVAVGRALAFAGFLADGRIASAEEMERFALNSVETKPEPVVHLATDAQRKAMFARAKEIHGVDGERELRALVANFGHESTKEVTAVEATLILGELDRQAKIKVMEQAHGAPEKPQEELF
jgi:hypothetical protein